MPIGARRSREEMNSSSDESRNFRVLTYNLLCSSLANPATHKMCKPEDLMNEHRFDRILKKLSPEILKGSIFCLQEVSLHWIGKLHVWFQEKGYTMITASYGTKYNGYMGIATAWPIRSYEAKQISIDNISNTKIWGSESPSAQLSSQSSSVFSRLVEGVLKLIPWTDRSTASSTSSERDAWSNARQKYNQMIFARLQSRSHKSLEFCIANYHMPCQYKCHWTMTIHTALACQHAQRLAKEVPYVLAGDFNFLPGSPQYELVKKGTMEKTNMAYPIAPNREQCINWDIDLMRPLKSAYFEILGHEPDITNWSCIKDWGEFSGTLDYLFHTENIIPLNVIMLESKKKLKGGGPCPTVYQPSDHLMLGATFQLL